ncbi:MAG: fasciclin domain-containing protein [Myxococcota bacterium]
MLVWLLTLACSGDEDTGAMAEDTGPGEPTAETGRTDTGSPIVDPPPPPTAAEVIEDRAELSALVEALTTAGLRDALAEPNDALTVLAPTDAAFTALGAVSPVPGVLANVLLFHVVPEEIAAADLASRPTLPTLSRLSLTTAASPTTIEGAELGATVDLSARNGLVHTLGQVLVPPTTVELLTQTPTLTTLKAALDASVLTSSIDPATLDGATPLTVFAPTNAALAAAGIELNNPPANLVEILQLHVVSGQHLVGDLSDGDVLTTVDGAQLEVAYDPVGGVTSLVDPRGRTTAISDQLDLRTLSGVVHVLDGVLLPSGN